MPDDKFDIDNLAAALDQRVLPTVTIWNRLEGRPRTADLTRALRAEVRDGLWMLTRQWQSGEFDADDAGSPVLAKVALASTTIDGFRAGEGAAGPRRPLDRAVPLEATVEARPVAELLALSSRGGIDLRTVMGRRFLRQVPQRYRADFVARYPFVAPNPDAAADAAATAHLEVWSLLAALAGRAMDGYVLYQHLTANPANTPWGSIAVAEADKTTIRQAGAAMVAWFDRMFVRPGGEPAGASPTSSASAWVPPRLEYAFAVEADVADGQKRLAAAEYHGGHLDWTAFSVDPTAATGRAKLGEPLTTIPTRAAFSGMPHPRWWTFEDGATNVGDIRVDTTDIARLGFVEFALAYGNDWYTVPVPLPTGTVTNVAGVVVTDVFGERLLVEATGRGADDDPHRWAMYGLDVAGVTAPGQPPQPADLSLVVPPTVAHLLEGPVLEEVVFLRDEIANLVWAVERTVLSPAGTGRRGTEYATELVTRLQRLAGAAAGSRRPPPVAAAVYELQTPVPEHWIPFLAVHVPGSRRATQLQRGALPRLVEGLAPEPVRPATSLLRPGLDLPVPQPMFVHEEEVPRAGTVVTLRFQRARWYGGRTALWLGVERTVGRGEGSSGLAFDGVVPIPRPSA